MSIVLEALKKARQDRQKQEEVSDDALFRTMSRDHHPEIPHKKNDPGRRPWMWGCLFLIVVNIVAGVFIILALKNGSIPGWSNNASSPESANVPDEQPSSMIDEDKEPTFPYKPPESPAPARLIIQIATPTPDPLPRQEALPKPSAPGIAQNTATPPARHSPTPLPDTDETRQISSTPPIKSAPTPSPTRKEFENPEEFGLAIEGVMWDEKTPAAVINNEIVTRGQIVSNCRITDITRIYIEIEKQGVKYRFKY